MANFLSSTQNITNSRITNNSAYYGGGGISLDDTNILLDGVLISNNFTNEKGGGIKVVNAAFMEMNNVTVINNTSLTNEIYGGPNISFIDPEPFSSSCTECSKLKVENSIFWQEVESELEWGAGFYYGQGFATDLSEEEFLEMIDYSIALDMYGISQDPQFVSSQDQDYNLLLPHHVLIQVIQILMVMD